jgi:YegS/Rv2252/BmrU family lipid kinase
MSTPFAEPPIDEHLVLSRVASELPEIRRLLGARMAVGNRLTTWVADRDDLESTVQRAIDLGADRILAAGGDGTVHGVVNGLLGSEHRTQLPSMGILPAGTANDAAQSLGVFDDVAMALTRLWDDELPALPTDVLRVREVQPAAFHALNVISFGLPASLTRDTPQSLKNTLGALAYLAYGLSRLPELQPFDVRIEGDGLDFDGRAFAVYVGNGSYAGGGFPVCPNALVDDGLLDVLIVPEMDAGNLVALAGDTTLRGDPRLHEFVEHHRLSAVTVSCPATLDVNVDGEPFPGGRWAIDVLPGALDVHRPLAPVAPGDLSARVS